MKDKDCLYFSKSKTPISEPVKYKYDLIEDKFAYLNNASGRFYWIHIEYYNKLKQSPEFIQSHRQYKLERYNGS